MTEILPGTWLIHPGWFAAVAIVLWATNALPEYLTALLAQATQEYPSIAH